MIIRRELEPILANVVETGSFVFTAGAIADDLALDVEGQTRQALGDLDKFLRLCGTSKRSILSAVIWVADIRLRERMNVAWLEWVEAAHLPARACIEGKVADPECLVEIQIIAVKE